MADTTTGFVCGYPQKYVIFGVESGIPDKRGVKGAVDKKDEIAEFAGAKERTEDTALIENSKGPVGLIEQVKKAESTATYVFNENLDSVGRYLADDDVIEFNHKHPYFPQTAEGRAAFRWHEVIHRADNREYRSWKNADFEVAIDTAKQIVNMVVDTADEKAVSVFDKVMEELKPLTIEDNIAVQDVLSALRQGKNDGLSWMHDEAYWKSDETVTYMEILANLGTLDLINGKGIDVVKRYFPELFNSYRRVVR